MAYTIKPYNSYFEVDEEKVIVNIPTPEFGMGCYKSITVMDKETFKKCYEMWIESKQDTEQPEDKQ